MSAKEFAVSKNTGWISTHDMLLAEAYAAEVNKELIEALKASRAEMIRRSNAVNTKPPNYNPWFVDWDIISTIDVALAKAGAK